MKAQAGRNILITGANTGIGRQTALKLAAQGASLFMAGRSEERTRPVMDEARAGGAERVEFIELDLGDLTSVRSAAQSFLQFDVPLHVLLNNAGLAAAKGATAQGFEIAFGVNHLGHYLLTELLLPCIEASAPSRIVIVASKAHYRVKALDLDSLHKPTSSPTGYPEYCVSKLCNVLHAQALARRFEGTGVKIYALHPGVVASDVWREVPWPIRPLLKRFMISNEEGSRTSVYCATSDEVADQNGRYYDACKDYKPSRLARDDAVADALMERSATWVA